MTDRRVRALGSEKFCQAAARAHHGVRPADADLAQPNTCGPGGVELLGQPPVETGRETRNHRRREATVRRALGDDALDAAVEVTGAQVEDGYHHRAGM